jgi:hypothetical protein
VELMVRVYDDGRARLGILYPYEFMAKKNYEQLLGTLRNEALSLQAEIVRGRLQLQFTGAHSGAKVVYREIEFRNEHLVRLRDAFAKGRVFDFVHVFPKSNTMVIAKPYGRAEFLAVKDFSLVGV